MRISNGLPEAAESAAEIGCETIQVFAANPHAWRSPEIKPDDAEKFRHLTRRLDLRPAVVHTPYLLNLASPNPQVYSRSLVSLLDHMHRAHLIGAEYVVTHIGSHKGAGFGQGIARICAAVSKALEKSNDVILLLENSAGSGDSIGSTFEELCTLLDGVGWHARVAICLDTAHLWAAGYDMSSPAAVTKVIAEFDAVVGLDRLRYLHFNDTRVRLGSRVDRHANIGVGHIGEEGFRGILNHPLLAHLAGVIEVPAKSIETDIKDLGTLKSLREAVH